MVSNQAYQQVLYRHLVQRILKCHAANAAVIQKTDDTLDHNTK